MNNNPIPPVNTNVTVTTDKDIYDFLSWLIEIVPQLYVDEKGYPRRKETGECIYIGSGNTDPKVMKPLIVYGASFTETDVNILNPFVEGLNKNPESEWFYSVIELSSANYVRMIQKSLIMHAIESKSKKEVKNNDMELAAILAPWVDKADETTIKELDQLTKKMSEYFNIFYLPKKREARIHCGLFNDANFRTANKKVRAKTWELLTTLTKQMFDTEDFSEYTVISKMAGCPQLDAVLRLLLKIYTMLNRYMKYLPEEVKEEFNHSEEIDLDYLSQCIDNLDLFRSKAKYLIPSAMASNNVNTGTGFNPISNVASSICIPGSSPVMPSMVSLPGQSNMSLFNNPQPQFSVGLGINFPISGVSVPGMGNGVPIVNVGAPGTPAVNTSAFINTGPFGRK